MVGEKEVEKALIALLKLKDVFCSDVILIRNMILLNEGVLSFSVAFHHLYKNK